MKLFSAAFLTANLFSHAVLILVALVYASPSHASTFGFSFINTANGSGTALVSGTISGLIDNASSQQATSVFVSFNGDGFGGGEYIGSPTVNNFTVAAGTITSAQFIVFGISNTAPIQTCCSLYFDLDTLSAFGLSQDSNKVLIGTGSLTFTPILFPVAETPLPAALPLFTTGLGALGLLGWRRKRKQAA